MKLLICTQTVDPADPVLGFFHGWIEELSKYYEEVTVICLQAGTYALPQNVVVYSAGKEKNTPRVVRWWLIARSMFALSSRYDAVLVHMNQEYILLGGLFWKLSGKRVYLWRNHYRGSVLTDIAALFCTKVFCTSKYSYTAKYKNTVRMPTGVSTDIFVSPPGAQRSPRSVLFLARMSPAKRPDIFIAALKILKRESVDCVAALYGSPLPSDRAWYEQLKVEGESVGAVFHPAVGNDKTPRVYTRFEVFVNCSPSGMYDKTMFEAMACQCLVLASSKDLSQLVEGRFTFKEGNASDLAKKLAALLLASAKEKEAWGLQLRAIAKEQTTPRWAQRVHEEMQSPVHHG